MNMKQRKKIRDGIGLYPPSDPNPSLSKVNTRPFLLAAVHLAAVWLLAVSWWQCLTSVFPIPADPRRLSLVCLCLTAVLVFLWHAPLKPAVRFLLLLLGACFAGIWIWKHRDAAVNVINLTANAWLEIRRPDALPYPLRPVDDMHLTIMFAMFLLPLLFLWSLILRIRKGTAYALLLLAAPAAWILIETKVPSEKSCWLLLFSGAVYAAVCGCREGRAALCKGVLTASMLALLILLSALISRPLESYKEPARGLYARTRQSIQTQWIRPMQDSYTQAKAALEAKKAALQNEPESSAQDETQPGHREDTQDPNQTDDPGNTADSGHTDDPKDTVDSGQADDLQDTADSGTADDLQDTADSGQTNDPKDTADSARDAGSRPVCTAKPAPDAADSPLFPTGSDHSETSDGTHTEQNGNSSAPDFSGGNGSGNTGGSADTFPDMNALSHFQPSTGTRLILTADSKPEETLYYPSAYGVIYENSRWHPIRSGVTDTSDAQGAAPSDEAVPPETYLLYPHDLLRLEAFCRENAPRTLADTSRLIQREFEAHTVYDFQPGFTPSGEDFAEYFLFENRKGFCVHFATTAVLIYRMCGYPARYVQGYAVPPSAFHRQEDGTYTAEATGEMGHAWCEVFQNGEWILKEHTLPYYGVRPVPGIPAASSSEHSWKRSAAGWGLQFLKICAAAFACLLLFLVLFFAQAALRRRRRYRRFRTLRQGAGIRRMYCAIYDTAVSLGMKKTDILSPRGVRSLRDFLPEIPGDSLDWMYHTVLETLFYQKTVTKEETLRAWQIYQQFSRMIQKDFRPLEKFIYRYVKIL